MRLFPYYRYFEEAGDDGANGGGGSGGDAGGAGGSGSLLDGAADGSSDGSLLNEGDPKPWDWAEGMKGEGDAPEWLNTDKYKTVEEQAKAQRELEKKLGGFVGAPEDGYEMTMPENLEGEIDDKDPLLNWFKDAAKEANMSQDLFTKMLHGWIEQEHGTSQVNKASEIEQMGPNAQTRLKALDDFGKSQLTPELYGSLLDATKTADGVKLVEHLLSLSKGTKLLRDSDADPVKTGVTQEELDKARFAKDEHGNRKMSMDPAYKKKVDAMSAEFHGHSHGTVVR